MMNQMALTIYVEGQKCRGCKKICGDEIVFSLVIWADQTVSRFMADQCQAMLCTGN